MIQVYWAVVLCDYAGSDEFITAPSPTRTPTHPSQGDSVFTQHCESRLGSPGAET